MAAGDVREDAGQEILPAAGGVPEVVMRIDNRQVGFQRGFAGPFCEPCREVGILPDMGAAIFAF